MNTLVKKSEKISVKLQLLAAVTAVVAAVALPQLLHTFGGASLGEALLPMHLPIMLVGFLAGPYAGFVSGIFAPVVSFALTGMPFAPILPFMVIELGVYGLSAGLLKNAKMPAILKTLLVQIAGRVIRAGAILVSVFAFANEGINVSIIWSSIIAGAVGIVLQLILIPVIIKGVKRASNEA